MADVTCPNCGCTPMGEGCYHICHNSTHYYSPEQERHDDQFYGDDYMREAYGPTADDAAMFTESEMEYDEQTERELEADLVDTYAADAWPNPLSIDPDDIPF